MLGMAGTSLPLLALAAGGVVLGWRFGGAVPEAQAGPSMSQNDAQVGLVEILQQRLDDLLWHNAQGDQERATAAAQECVRMFGQAALDELIARGHAAALAIDGFGRGLSRLEVLAHLRACSDAALESAQGIQAA